MFVLDPSNGNAVPLGVFMVADDVKPPLGINRGRICPFPDFDAFLKYNVVPGDRIQEMRSVTVVRNGESDEVSLTRVNGPANAFATGNIHAVLIQM